MDIFSALASGARNIVSVALAKSAAGIIVGVVALGLIFCRDRESRKAKANPRKKRLVVAHNPYAANKLRASVSIMLN